MKDTSTLIIGLLFIALLSLFVDTSVTLAVVSGLIGYLVPKHIKHPEDQDDQ